MKTQEEKDNFTYDWKMKYIHALKTQKDITAIILTNGGMNDVFWSQKRMIELEIESLELQQKIFWEEIAMADYKKRVDRWEEIRNVEIEDARKNMKSILDKAMKSKNTKVRDLVMKYETLDIENNIDDLITWYKSIKLKIEDDEKYGVIH